MNALNTCASWPGTTLMSPPSHAPCGSSSIAGSTTEFVRPILNALTVTISALPIAATLLRVLPLIM